MHAEADRLDEQWRAENAEIASFEARPHTQPDGSRTLSTVEELDDVRQLVMRRWRDKSVAEIRERAEHWRHMADRRARTARPGRAPAAAGDRRTRLDQPGRRRPGDEEAGLVWRGADAADYAARLEDAFSDDRR